MRTLVKPLMRFGRAFNGPQTLGNSPLFWICWLAVVIALIVFPLFASRYHVLTASNFLISTILAMSLCLIWGYCGILSLGQAAFYCIGGYAYGIVAMNLIDNQGNTDLAIVAGVVVPAAFAALIGALMFYSRLKGVYVAILMLVTSLLLGLFMRQTADPSYTIGGAYLGGMNGLAPAKASDPSLPSIILGFGNTIFEFDGRGRSFYWLVLGAAVAIYLGLRCIVNSSFGYVLVAVREDPERTETFGYDVRLVQLAVFCLSAAIAGFAGTLYTAWGTYIHPDGFSVGANILVVIWVAVGGRKDLSAVIVSTVALNWISIELATWGEISMLMLGVILVCAMLIAPDGVFTGLGSAIGRATRRRAPAAAPNSEPSPSPASAMMPGRSQ
jgi:ABC-type branched-subunit amino acid transport system permease subunit